MSDSITCTCGETYYDAECFVAHYRECGKADRAQGEPDLFWDYDNPEDSGHEDEHDLADYCAQDLPYGESMTVDVMCAKRLPTRQMKIWVDDNDDLQWEWLTGANPPEQESE